MIIESCSLKKRHTLSLTQKHGKIITRTINFDLKEKQRALHLNLRLNLIGSGHESSHHARYDVRATELLHRHMKTKSKQTMRTGNCDTKHGRLAEFISNQIPYCE